MKLVLFFTRGISLKTWVDTGLFEREKLIYEEHLKRGNLGTVYWLTYGSRDAELARKLHAEKRLHPGIQVISMPCLFKGQIGKLIYSFLIPLLQKTCLRQADIYKTNQMDGSWSAVLAKWLYHKPLIIRTGYTLSLFARRLKKPKSRILIYELIEGLAYKYATYATVTTKKDEKYISDIYGYPQKDIVIIPNYIDTNIFRPQKSKKYTDRIVFVGRLSEQKNLFNLISAIAKTDLTLDIYGKGELRGSLEKHARKQGTIVNFMGMVPNSELPDILNRYQYYTLPSYFEGMPKTLLEAMACGCVCIGTDVEGINEVIKTEINGFLADGTDAAAVHKALCKAMAGDNECIARHAVETIQSDFSLDSIVKQDQAISFCESEKRWLYS